MFPLMFFTVTCSSIPIQYTIGVIQNIQTMNHVVVLTLILLSSMQTLSVLGLPVNDFVFATDQYTVQVEIIGLGLHRRVIRLVFPFADNFPIACLFWRHHFEDWSSGRDRTFGKIEAATHWSQLQKCWRWGTRTILPQFQSILWRFSGFWWLKLRLKGHSGHLRHRANKKSNWDNRVCGWKSRPGTGKTANTRVYEVWHRSTRRS